jgi:hypothetical protein
MAAGPDGTAAPQHPVHRLRDADRESLKPVRERRGRVGFGDETNAVALDRERDDAERALRRARDGGANDEEDRGRSQRHAHDASPQRHVHGCVAILRGSRPVRHVATRAGHRLATGADPPTAVLANDEPQLTRAFGHALIGQIL